MFHGNHYIFKLFDGKNFYDINNFKTEIPNEANNTYTIDGIDFELSLGVYYCKG
jgi:hypothetical protein